MSESLKGKVAVMTGVGSGFGKATAELFARLDQVNLVLIDRNEQALNETAECCRSYGSQVVAIPGDEMDDEINRKIIDLNLTSAIMSCRTFTPMFKAQGYGKIVNVSSACDRRCWQGWSVYSAAKAAVNQFTKCLYTELRPHGVAVTLLVPGGSNTGFQAAAAGVTKFEWDEELAVRPEHFADMVYQACALTRGGCVVEMVVYGLAQDVSGF